MGHACLVNQTYEVERLDSAPRCGYGTWPNDFLHDVLEPNGQKQSVHTEDSLRFAARLSEQYTTQRIRSRKKRTWNFSLPLEA